jgi:enoyl-CoA hydratase/carnithine racemase
MSAYTNLELEKRGHIAVVTFHNPPAHTWTQESLRALQRLVGDLEADREIYSLVLTGEGRRFFSAGADLKLFATGDQAMARDMAHCFGEAFETLARFRGVAIAAINGYAMGGGLECAMACDVRIAEEHAVLALPEPKVGLLPCGGGTQMLSWLIGEGWAKRMILCGERVDAATAQRIGLVQEVVPQGQGLEKALALAARVAEQSPISVAYCKQLIHRARQRPLLESLAAERAVFVDLFDTQDQREGVQAFLDKRPPVWKNA